LLVARLYGDGIFYALTNVYGLRMLLQPNNMGLSSLLLRMQQFMLSLIYIGDKTHEGLLMELFLIGLMVGLVIGRAFDVWVDWKYKK
jgi:hypothetical protein